MDLEAENKELKRRLAAAEAVIAENAKLDEAVRDSETRHRLIIESWTQAVWETDGTGVVVTDSPSWRAYTGQTPEEWLGYGWLDAIHPDDRAFTERQWRDAMAARQVVDAEFRLRAPNGGWRWTNVRAAPVLDAQGHIEKWAGVNIDIDARIRAESALRESEARYRNLFETMRQGYVENELIRDANGRAVDYRTKVVNPQFERLTGIPAADAIGRTARDLVKELDPAWIETYDRVVRTGEPEQFEREEPAFGRWFEVQAYPLVGDRFAILYDDITPRKRAEAALRESEARFRALVTAGGNSIYRMSPDWRLMYQLDSDTLAPTAAPVEDWVEKYIPPDDLPAVRAAIDRAIRTRSLFELEHRVWVADGGIGWVISRAVPLLGDDGRIIEWFGAGTVVTERMRAEDALRESEKRYRALFESMDEAYAVVDVLKDEAGAWADFRFVEVNPAFIAHTSMPWPVGKTATELLGTPNPRWTQLYGQALDTGEAIRVEEDEPTLDRVFDLNIFPLDRKRSRVAVLFANVTARKRAEAALRESKEREAFLLKLADALRPLADPIAAQALVAQMLGQEMKVDRCYYAEFDWTRDVLTINQEYVRSTSFSVVGEHPISSFKDLLQFSHKGEPLVCDNIAEHPIFRSEVAAYRERGTDGFILMPLIKEGRMAACMCVTMTVPRTWSPSDIELVREVGDRTWDASQRIRAESALRESEERFRQFAEASAAGLWIRHADTLAMEYVSPAIWKIYGIEPDAFLGDMKRWAALILPEDREAALAHIERARQGDAVVHEFRIRRPNDQAFRWIRNTDFPLLNRDGGIERVGGIAEDVTGSKLAVEHQGVLLAELQHRVRNIMAMIRSMALRTADGAADVADYRSLLEGWLLALARVQVLLTREANSGGSLRDIVQSEVSAQAHRNDQFELGGPDIRLSPKAVEVLTLAFHELATNALKYGAFATPRGRLRVSWAPFEKRGRSWLALDWSEEGVSARAPATRRGFGSDLIEGRVPYELGGTGKVVIGPGGAHCRLAFPLKDGESILETDAPMPAKLFGGTLDMTDAPDLTGRRVLVVEDDYYMAGDTAAALRGAGAAVLGPCPSEEATFDLLDGETPTHAVLDLNLGGGGPRFKIAHALKARGIPFIFLTGYDPEVVPADLEDVMRLQKPVPFQKIVEAVSQL